MHIGLYIPCHTDALFPELRSAIIELLVRFGQVAYPRDPI